MAVVGNNITTEYNVGDNVKVFCNSIVVGVGTIESINETMVGYAYHIKLDTPVTHVDCLHDDLELISNGNE